MKEKDASGRRWRFAPARDDGMHIVIKNSDIDIFHFIHIHGGRLPTTFIHGTRGGHLQSLQVRLKRFYNKGYLARPFQQQETIDPEYNQLIHELTPKSESLLKERGLFHENAPSPHGAFKHQVMLSCLSASFHLEAGEKYVPQYTLPNVSLVMRPDEVFALKYDKPPVIFLEADRGTEITRTENLDRKSWSRTIRQYRDLLLSRDFEAYGYERAIVLIATISEAKVQGILSVIAEEFPNGCSNIMVASFPEFGRAFKPPKVLDVMNMYWYRSGYPAFKFS
jgi:hypothetical protein